MIEKGQQALVCLGGPWVRATIVRCNEDGTFNVVPVGQENRFMSKWEGLTAAEVALDDEAAWPALYEAMRGASEGVGREEVRAAFERLGATVDEERMRGFWSETCAAQFPDREPEGLMMNRDEAYAFFVSAGYSARLLAGPEGDPARDRFKLYWNQVRMGGRDPAEVGRAIGVDDALAAIGLGGTGEDPARAAAVLAFGAREGLELPAELVSLWSRPGIEDAILASHCNNPEPVRLEDWTVRRDDRTAVRVMLPHQGDHAWWAVFDGGAAEAEVWLSFEEDGAPVRRVAHSLAFFFWDLAQTGRCWKLAGEEG